MLCDISERRCLCQLCPFFILVLYENTSVIGRLCFFSTICGMFTVKDDVDFNLFVISYLRWGWIKLPIHEIRGARQKWNSKGGVNRKYWVKILPSVLS